MAMKAWVETMRLKGRITGYRVRYCDASGSRKSERGVFEKWHDAKALCDVVQDRLFNGRLGRIDPGLLTKTLVEKFLLECRSGVANKNGKPLRESTLYTYGMSLNYLVHKQPRIALCDETCFKELKNEMVEADLMPWTIAGKLKDMRTFMRWCKRSNIIALDPFENFGISQPSAMPRYYTDEELRHLDEAAVGDPFHLAYWLGVKCGLRRSEVLRADKRDIRWLEDGTGELMVWANVSKSGAFRSVPLPVSVMELIGTRGQGLLYLGMTHHSFNHAWTHLKVKAGILERPTWLHKRFKWAGDLEMGKEDEQARFHDLRHTFCRIFLESGAGDIQILSKITGHQSLDVLNKIYSHFRTSVLHQAIKTMESRPKFVGVSWEKTAKIVGLNGDMTGQDGTTFTGEKIQKESDK